MIETAWGCNYEVCASFLSQLEVYDENVGLVAKKNTQQHRCLLFPIVKLLSSSMIIKVATLLDSPHLCQLADQETPTSTTENLATSDNMGFTDDESEDYNDISSIDNFSILMI